MKPNYWGSAVVFSGFNMVLALKRKGELLILRCKGPV